MKHLSAICILLFTFIFVLRAEDPRFEQPALITSAGQSAEVQIASVLAKRAGIAAVLGKLAGVEDLNLHNPKTIMLVMGVSMKGMGAAGLDMDQEKERISALLHEAGERSIPILFLHLGGEARRGDLSDALIEEYIPFASAVIAVKSGNSDGFFTTLCDRHSIKLIEVDRAAEALTPLKSLFGIE